MLGFSQSNFAFGATTYKLDKDIQGDRERYKTRYCSKKRDMACRLIVVIYLKEIMSTISGPLANHINYLRHIALPNCIDYFDFIRKIRECGDKTTPTKFNRLRLFLNAFESLNNIPDYFFHDTKITKGWSSSDEGRILGIIRNQHRILRDAEQIANAYKHSERHRGGLNAADMQGTLISVSSVQNSIELTFEFNSIEDEKILNEAFQFWVAYENNPDNSKLLPVGK